jgi:geranylgeranyl pyrophosphate synthase
MQTLLTPIHDLGSRPSKAIRAQAVEVASALTREILAAGFFRSPEPAAAGLSFAGENLELAALLVEVLHSGSLIIDDIEDASVIRRGAPTLHLKYGLAVALNAGNWMYFATSRLIEKMRLTDAARLSLYQTVQHTLYEAHLGQALDVGVRIEAVNQEQIPAFVLRGLELKSGALVGLAMSLGAMVSGAPAELQNALRQFGRQLGVGLQMFDDLGNFSLAKPSTKHLEDLVLGRPSWVWAVASRLWSAEQFSIFISACADVSRNLSRNHPSSGKGHLSPPSHPNDFAAPIVEAGRTQASEFVREAFANLHRALDLPSKKSPAWIKLEELAERISRAY